MASTLNGRLAKLEATMLSDSDHCRVCGLRHVQPLTMDVARHLLGPVSGMGAEWNKMPPRPAPRLCLCDPCCGDPGDRRMARLSHGYDGPFEAA